LALTQGVQDRCRGRVELEPVAAVEQHRGVGVGAEQERILAVVFDRCREQLRRGFSVQRVQRQVRCAAGLDDGRQPRPQDRLSVKPADDVPR
jgi:hypothetical protein